MSTTENDLANEPAISDATGQLDARFVLWRVFCAEAGIPVDTMPSELKGEQKERWEKIKDNKLHKPTEETPTKPMTTES